MFKLMIVLSSTIFGSALSLADTVTLNPGSQITLQPSTETTVVCQGVSTQPQPIISCTCTDYNDEDVHIYSLEMFALDAQSGQTLWNRTLARFVSNSTACWNALRANGQCHSN